MAEVANLTTDHDWYVGSKLVIGFTVVTSEPDISGWSIEWVFRKNAREDDILLRKETGGDGVQILSGTDKTVAVTIDAEDTADLEGVTGEHALRRIDVGDETLLAEGTAVLQMAAAR